MRILHVNKFLYRRGGAEGYLLDLAQLQQAAGHDVEFFGMSHPDNLPMRYSAHFPKHVEFEPPPASLTGRLQVAGRMIWSRSAENGLVKVIEDFRPDVAHLHNIYHQLSPSVVHALRRHGVPSVLTMHDYKLVCPTYQFLDQGQPCTACVTGGTMTAMRRRCKDGALLPSALAAVETTAHRVFGAYDAIAALISPSRFLRDRVAQAGVGQGRLVHLPNFTDLSVMPTSNRGGPALFLGRLSHEKGVSDLVQAIGLLSQTQPDGILLDIAGEGPLRPDLEAQADRIAPGRVRFHGRLSRPDLIELASSASVSVVPSVWFENQPLSVLESYALGLPVIGTDLGGLPELITPGVTGALVPPHAPEALAEALAAYLDDEQLAIAHGRSGRELVEAEHSGSGHASRVEELYAAVLQAAGEERRTR